MFAKLKKKVIEENGGRIEGGDKSLGSSPTSRVGSGSGTVIVQSPTSKEPPIGLRAAYSLEHLAATRSTGSGDESSGSRDSGASREEVLALLTKRTEQCKKMEGNISDLAALIKDKNKLIDQLENQTRSQEEVLNKRLLEQKKEFEAYRDKLIAGYQGDKLALDKLLLTQQDLEACRTNLEEKSQRLISLQERESHMETDLTAQTDRADRAVKECERLKEDNKERAELVMSLSKEKAVFERRVDQLNTELTEKQNKISELNRHMSELDSQYRALEHSSETHRSKAELQSAKLVAEKQDHIDMLQERVTTLEQRLQGQGLSGDDRVTALQTEREGFEKKLSEARQQLTEIKSTWSDRIAQLEAQISHLNTKIIEDSEELANSQRATDSMRDNFHKQMEDLRCQLEDADKRALENYELATSSESRYEHNVRDLESELTRARLTAVDSETQLRGKITSLEVQLTELQTARQTEQEELRHQIEHATRDNEASLTRELLQEQLWKTCEMERSQLQSDLLTKEKELLKLRKELDETTVTTSGRGKQVELLESQVQQLEVELTLVRNDLMVVRRQFNQADQEKGDLMVRNAQLFQQLTTLQQQLSEVRSESESQLADRDHAIATQQDSILQLHSHLAQLEKQVVDLETVQAEQGSTDHMIRHLQDQLAEKTRALRKQEQTVKDLRQTLQRELKVQSLPNDDSNTASDDNNTPSPIVSRKYLPRQAVPPTSLSHYGSGGFGGSTSALASSSAVLTVSASTTSSATAAVKPMTLTNLMQVSQERGLVVRRDLEQDINFQYLKHVVLKFMLSREAEAVQLIKAVAVLLNFSHQEQQLIKQTLEWKMSWFGSRPSMGRGQKSKIVPPTF